MNRFRWNKFNAVKVKSEGITFDSKMEHEWHSLLKLDPELAHIDVHVPVSLPGGVRFKVDFIVYYKGGRIEAHEVKGKEMQDFKTKRKLFDEFHPLAPLIVVRKKRKKWERL